MDESDLSLLRNRPEWQSLLTAYLVRSEEERDPAASEATGAGPRWYARQNELAEIPAEELSVAHGQMIARGWLLFQLGDGAASVEYRVSPEGRDALAKCRAA